MHFENIDPADLILIGDSLIDSIGLIGHHLDSANKFYTQALPQIIQHGFQISRNMPNVREATEDDRQIDSIFCQVIPTSVSITPPSSAAFKTGYSHVLYPTQCILRKNIYSGSLFMGADVIAEATLKNGSTLKRTATIEPFKICDIPIIKGSVYCNTYGKTSEELQAVGEDPSDKGVYFGTRGEWSVDMTENITYNQCKIYINTGYGKSNVRTEFISKPGDAYQNSDYLIFQYYNDGTITINIARDKVKDIQFPFYMIFRAFGWTNDRELFDNIVMDYDADINKKILEILVTAMKSKYIKMPAESQYAYDSIENLKYMVDSVPDENQISYRYLDLKNNPDKYHNAYDDMRRIFDIHCLPHIGMSLESRHEKLKYMALIIRKMLLVHIGALPQTDRDSFRNKRIHAIGENYAKVLKTYFNQAIVTQMRNRMKIEFQNNPFNAVNLVQMVKSCLVTDDFERLVVQTIVTGNKSSMSIKNKSIVNRLSAQNLHRKNQLNVFAIQRQIIATASESAKQSTRAHEMRRVHLSALGYICPNHTPPEGDNVGMTKQLSLYATIAPSSSSEALKKIVIEDVIPENKLRPVEIFRRNLARVYVNGHLMGYVENALEFATKYRKMRRTGKIDMYATVYWDNIQNEVQLFVDMGRLVRPLIIVYNTNRDADVLDIKKGGKGMTFEQGICITQDDIDGLYKHTITIQDLIAAGKVEFISPEEQENCLICPSYTELMSEKHNEYKEYTHCDIEIELLGLTAATAPFGNHNNAARDTYQTSQAKQTAGRYALNFPFRMDKEAFLQYVNETPLVRTITNKYIFPNGCNIKVAIMCYSGYNEEDSLIASKAAFERGLFNGSKFTFYETEIEQKETRMKPIADITSDIKTYANYEKLVDGCVVKGTRIKENDVLIGKLVTNAITKGNDQYQYSDKSVIYKESEEAIVTNVIYDRTGDENKFCKVGIKKIRPVEVGDKASARSGQKGIFALMMREADLPMDAETGETPSLIFNPHGIPSRMTVSQLIESLYGNLCAIRGGTVDGTMFKPVNIDDISNELKQAGFHPHGMRRMISGITGEYIDMLIFEGPTFYQRLLKHVKDAQYSVQTAVVDQLTRQPTESAGSQTTNKGLRVGEMEKDVILSSGMAGLLHEKFTNHCDGYIEHMCRCGAPAIVNTRDNLYKCKYCGDGADIYTMPTTYTSKLLRQELMSSNIGVKVLPKPFTYEKYDDADRTLTKNIEQPYSANTIKNLRGIFDNQINVEEIDADE